jgi:hypothetical protein
MKKGEFRGNCQFCGAIQVVNAKGEMAKHGYTVDGVFHGVCSGADHQPLQVNRSLLNDHVEILIDRAHAYGQHAAKLESGELTPLMVRKLTQWGSPVNEYKMVGGKKRYVPVHVRWEDAGEQERVQGLKEDIESAKRAESQSRRSVQWLLELAEMVHGKPLIDRAQEELDAIRVRTEKKAPIEGASPSNSPFMFEPSSSSRSDEATLAGATSSSTSSRAEISSLLNFSTSVTSPSLMKTTGSWLPFFRLNVPATRSTLALSVVRAGSYLI